MPPPDVGGYDDGEFIYDGHDDMVRDVRNYNFNHYIDSLSSDHAVGDPTLIDLLEQIRKTNYRDLGVSLLDHLRLPTVHLGLPAMRLG